MTPEEKQLVRSTYATLMAHPDTFAAAFYRRLFERDPALRALFQIDMAAQGRKFVDMMQMALDCMESLDHIVPLLWQTGKRHGGYGVESKDYDTVRVVLLEAMQEAGGTIFTPAAAVAWTTLYDLIAATMETAASEGIIPRHR